MKQNEKKRKKCTGTSEADLDSRNHPLATKDWIQLEQQISLDEHQSNQERRRGGRRVPLLPFAKEGKGGKSALFMKNDNLLWKH